MPHNDCSMPVRPFVTGGKWVDAGAQLNPALHFHTDGPLYKPSTCKTLDAIVTGSKYYRGNNKRFDDAYLSRLIWVDAEGLPQRPFDAHAFLSRFRNSDVVIVGDSFSGIMQCSLSALVGCSQPDRDLTAARRGGNPSSRGMWIPEFNVSIVRQATRFLTPEVTEARKASEPSYFVQGGKRVQMRAQNVTRVVRLDVPGLGEWADPEVFRRAGLVIMKANAWAEQFRSDVKVVTRQGVLGENTSVADFQRQIFATGMERAMAWFDVILPPTAIVAWAALGGLAGPPARCNSTIVGKACRGKPQYQMLKLLEKRRSHWVGCRKGMNTAECAASRPRQWVLDTSHPGTCRPDAMHMCFGHNTNGSIVNNHPSIPGMPDLWNAMLLDSVLEDDARCATPLQLRREASRAHHYAAMDREASRARSRAHAARGGGVGGCARCGMGWDWVMGG